MEVLKQSSAYAKMILPFLAAILSVLNTYHARDKPWRFVAGIIVTVSLLAYGCITLLPG
jgi:hypothetical protein